MSKLKANDFIKHIKASRLPGHFKTGFSARGNTIVVTTKNIIDPKRRKTFQLPYWYQLIELAGASSHNSWEITTGEIWGAKRPVIGLSQNRRIGESTSIRADIKKQSLVLLRSKTATKTGPKKPLPKSSLPKRIVFTKSRAQNRPRVYPKIIKKQSIGAGTVYVVNNVATDALGLCVPSAKWHGQRAPVGYVGGKGGLLIVANRVDPQTFKSRSDASLSKRLVANVTESLLHEMIHAGLYEHSPDKWIGHPSKAFHPFESLFKTP